MKLCLLTALLAAITFPAWAELELKLLPPQGPLRPGETATLQAELSGVEAGKQYALLPPEPTLSPVAEWGTLAVSGVESSLLEGQPRLRLNLLATPKEPGSFSIPSLQARAMELPEGAPLVGESLDISKAVLVASAPLEITVKADRTPLYLAAAALAGVSGLVIISLALWRRNKARPEESTLSPLEQAREHIHTARRHRLDGDFYKFYQALAAAARAPGIPAAQALAPKMEERAQQVGYSGVRPTEDELDGALKDIERALAPRQED